MPPETGRASRIPKVARLRAVAGGNVYVADHPRNRLSSSNMLLSKKYRRAIAGSSSERTSERANRPCSRWPDRIGPNSPKPASS